MYKISALNLVAIHLDPRFLYRRSYHLKNNYTIRQRNILYKLINHQNATSTLDLFEIDSRTSIQALFFEIDSTGNCEILFSKFHSLTVQNDFFARRERWHTTRQNAKFSLPTSSFSRVLRGTSNFVETDGGCVTTPFVGFYNAISKTLKAEGCWKSRANNSKPTWDIVRFFKKLNSVIIN
jgi:hypothetical protein